MRVTEKLLSVNPYSRPGRALAAVKGVILHWTGAPMQRAVNTWGWFERGCPKEKHYSSAHYIIDLDGAALHAVPDHEIAYHCGSSLPDPASGRIYTDWARERFGSYAADPERSSPNCCALGIELCVTDSAGHFTPETLGAAIALSAKLLGERGLGIECLGTHRMAVGWKDCPRLWTARPELFEEFRAAVMALMGRER